MNNNPHKTTFHLTCLLCHLFLCLSALQLPAWGQTDEGTSSRWQRFKQIRETQRANKEGIVSEESLGAKTENIHVDAFGGREILVYVPSSLPTKGQRALLVALHGGGGNAEFMRDHLKIDGVAERNGFISGNSVDEYSWEGSFIQTNIGWSATMPVETESWGEITDSNSY